MAGPRDLFQQHRHDPALAAGLVIRVIEGQNLLDQGPDQRGDIEDTCPTRLAGKLGVEIEDVERHGLATGHLVARAGRKPDRTIGGQHVGRVVGHERHDAGQRIGQLRAIMAVNGIDIAGGILILHTDDRPDGER
jgi:hypothetical protein